MKKFEDINDFESGQVLMTKKGYKMEVVSVHKDKNLGEELNTGSVCMKIYAHKDSNTCRSYGWTHNSFCFTQFIRTDGKEGLIKQIQNESWNLQ